MRFRLRTLLILLALGPPITAIAYAMWAAPGPSPWFTDDEFNFNPPPGWSLKLQAEVNRKIEADRKAGLYPLTNNRP